MIIPRHKYQSNRLAWILFVILACVIVGGCAGGSGKYTGDFTTNHEIDVTQNPDGSTITKIIVGGERHAKSSMNVTAPGDAKDPSTISLGDNGATASSGSSYEPKVIDWTKKNYYIFYIGALIFIGLGVACFFAAPFARWKAMGIPLAAVGVFAALLPTIIDTIGVPIAIIILIVPLAAGAVWMVAHWNAVRKFVDQPK